LGPAKDELPRRAYQPSCCETLALQMFYCGDPPGLTNTG